MLLIPYISSGEPPSTALQPLPPVEQGKNLYEDQLDRGIKNSVPYSYMLIEQVRANKARTKDILNEALKYSPDLPAAYFELAKENLIFSPREIFKTVDYMRQGIASYNRNFWWLFTITGSLFLSAVLSLIISTVIIILIRLLFDISLLSHDIKENKSKALLLLLLPISALFGPLFLIGSVLLIIGLYMKSVDKISVYLYLLFLVISPLIFNTASTFLSAPASGKIKAVVQVNESRDNKYALSVLKKRNNHVEHFSYALAAKREGGYNDAIDIYNKLMPSPIVFNNLANCYVAINDIEKAKELYKKSVELQPLPAALYNLSIVSRETLEFEKGDEYFLSAQKLAPDAVSWFRTIFSKNPNRFVIDENLPMSTLWEYVFEKTHSTINFSIAPQNLTPAIALTIAILFYILNKYFKHRAYRCKRCGKVLCTKCEKHVLWGRMCQQCYKSLIKIGELDAKERITILLAVYEHQKRRRSMIKIISFIMPGLGLIYAGNVLYGLFFLWSFLFLLFLPISNWLFVPEMPGFSHTWLSMCSLLFMGLVYITSNLITLRRLSRGWL